MAKVVGTSESLIEAVSLPKTHRGWIHPDYAAEQKKRDWNHFSYMI